MKTTENKLTQIKICDKLNLKQPMSVICNSKMCDFSLC